MGLRGAVLGILVVAVFNAATKASIQRCTFPTADLAVKHLSKIITFKTVSDTAATGGQEFHGLNSWLADAYADVWGRLRVKQVGADQLSLLLTWQGSDSYLDPVLFISHTDVVPVEEDTLKDWLHPPFSGAVAEGCIWGRGAQDVKVGLIGLLEAATVLLQEGYRPVRTLLFAFGHDEEIGGAAGAGQIAALLATRYKQLEIIIDEGVGVAMDGVAPFTQQPAAVVATAEKRIQTVQVTLHSEGGHSSRPPIDGSSIGDRLARLLTAVARQPPPARLIRPAADFLQAMIPLASGPLSLLLRGVAVSRPLRWLMARVMAATSAEAAALVRSTAIVTRITAGVADNVIPQTATVKINFRLLPGDTPETALQQTKRWVGRDADYADVSLSDFANQIPLQPMPVAHAHGPHFAIMRRALQQAWKLEGTGQSVHVVPLLLPAMTDSRHYATLSPNGALRWTPGTFTKEGQELAGIHGVNERISVNDFICGLVTYRELLRQLGDYVGPVSGDAAALDKQKPTAATEL